MLFARQHIGRLFRAYDLEVAELAVSVVFYACMPSVTSTSTVAALEEDNRDAVEVRDMCPCAALSVDI